VHDYRRRPKVADHPVVADRRIARLAVGQGYWRGSRKTARPMPNPIRPSTPTTTSGNPKWMKITVALRMIPMNVTQPLQPSPRFMKLRIASTLLGASSGLSPTNDVGRLAPEPDVEQNYGPHSKWPPGLGTLQHLIARRPCLEPIEQLDSSWCEVVIGHGIDQTGAPHQDALRKVFADTWKCPQHLQAVGLR